MNVKPWWPTVAAVLIGSHVLALRASQLRDRVWAGVLTTGQHLHTPASPAAQAQIDGVGPTRLWSSMVTRAIHRVEEFTMLLIMLHFAVGTLGILLGW